jgi:hypothetical protein
MDNTQQTVPTSTDQYSSTPPGYSYTTPSPKPKRIGVLIGVVLALVILGGAAYAYFAGYFTSLEQVARDAFVHAKDATGATFDTTITVDTSGLKKESTSRVNPLGDMFAGNSTFTTKGAYDFSDPANTKINATLSLSLGSTALGLEFRAIEGTAYMQLTKAPVIAFIPTLAKAENTWVAFPYKSESKHLTQSPAFSFVGVDPSIIEKLTDEQKAHLGALTKDAHFITITKRLPPEEIQGDLSYHFMFELDRAGIAAYFQEVKEYINEVGKDDSTLSSFDPTTYTKKLNEITDFTGELWIARADKLPRKVVIGFGMPIEEQGTVKVSITSIFKDWNAPLTVEKPAKTLTFEQLFAKLAGMPVTETTTSSSSSQLQADALTKATLSNLRASAELYYDNAGNQYKGVCTSGDFNSARSKYGLTCVDTASEYAASARLSTGAYYCVDSTGASKQVASVVTSTKCPAN